MSTTSETLVTIPFVVSFVGAVISLFMSIMESIAIRRYKEYAYKLGPKVLTLEYQSSQSAPQPFYPHPVELSGGWIKATDECNYLFRTSWDAWSAASIRGSIRKVGGVVKVEGRFPLFPILYFAFGMLFWSAGGIVVVSSGGSGVVILALLFGWTFIGWILVSSWRREVRSVHKVLAEANL